MDGMSRLLAAANPHQVLPVDQIPWWIVLQELPAWDPVGQESVYVTIDDNRKGSVSSLASVIRASAQLLDRPDRSDMVR
jgi:hypothetical protein